MQRDFEDGHGAGDADDSTSHLYVAIGGDAALLHATGAGSRQAFAALMRRYVAPVYAWSATRTSSPAEATRVTAAVFRSVRDRAVTAPDDCDVDSWMLDACQRAAGPMTGGDDAALPSVADLDAVWVGSKVRAVFASLPSAEREALESPSPPTPPAPVTDACRSLHRALVHAGVRPPADTRPESLCDRSDEVGPYMFGAADGASSTSLRRHLESCPSCRALCAELDGLPELLEAASLAADPPAGLVETVLADVPATPETPAGRPRRRPPASKTPDEFVFGPDRETARRGTARTVRRFAAYLLASAIGAAVVIGISFAMSHVPATPLESLASGATGTVAITPNSFGSAVVVDADGLSPGRHDVVVATDGGTVVGAGTFDSKRDGTAHVTMQTAAVDGVLEIRTNGRAVLRARITRG